MIGIASTHNGVLKIALAQAALNINNSLTHCLRPCERKVKYFGFVGRSTTGIGDLRTTNSFRSVLSMNRNSRAALRVDGRRSVTLIGAGAASDQRHAAVLISPIHPIERLLNRVRQAAAGWARTLGRTPVPALPPRRTVAGSVGGRGATPSGRLPPKIPSGLTFSTTCVRICFAGELTPRSGAYEFLAALNTWAEETGGRAVEVCWLDDGDLAGVLAAQVLAHGVSQCFVAARGQEEAMRAQAQPGLAVIAASSKTEPRGHRAETDAQSPVLETLAAGSLILGSRLNRDVQRFIVDGVNGWLFDPRTPGGLLDALTRMLATSEPDLREMRRHATLTAAASRAQAARRQKLPVEVGGRHAAEMQPSWRAGR